MSVLIFLGEDEFLTTELARSVAERFKAGRVIVESEEDWAGFNLRQEGLFAQGTKKVVFIKNQLRRKNKKKIENLKNSLDSNHFIFIENEKKKFFCPRFIKQKAKLFNVDVLSRRYSFWKKIAGKMGATLSYAEFQEAVSSLGGNLSLLWTLLAQKALISRPLSYLLKSWSWGNVFALIEAFHQRSLIRVLQEIRSLRLSEADPLQVWYLLASEFVRLYQFKNGVPLGVHPFVKQKLKQTIGLYSLEQLEDILGQLYETDLRLKTGFFAGSSSQKHNWEVILSFVFWWFFSFDSKKYSTRY